MDFRSLLKELRDQVRLVNTEDDAERVTKAITALRTFSEARRQGIVQLRINQQSVKRNENTANQAEHELREHF